jgi:hypothetical protein
MLPPECVATPVNVTSPAPPRNVPAVCPYVVENVTVPPPFIDPVFVTPNE